MYEGKFIIERQKRMKEGWESIRMKNGYYLNYNKLQVVANGEKDQFLLGHAWQVCADKPAPAQIIRDGISSEQELLREEYSWAGRYVIVFRDQIWLDYGGQMGVFYSGEACSNSLRLLRVTLDRDFIDPKLNHNLSPDFVLGMRTMYRGISRLLPSQYLNYVNDEVHERPIFPVKQRPTYSTEKIFNEFEHLYSYSLQNMKQEFKNSDIFVALSGGYDSRTTLAMLYKAGVSFSAFTLEHPNISRGDIVLPAKVSQRLGIPYRFVARRKKNYDPEAKRRYLHATEHMVVDEDVDFYAYGQYQAIIGKRPAVILRNGLWATIREPYFENGPVDRSRFEKNFPGLLLDDNMKASFHEYMDYLEHGKLNQDIPMQDRVYLELRVGCWRADIEGGFDGMQDIESIDPVNSRILLHLLKQLDHVQKRDKKHEVRITNDAAPSIADIIYEKQYTSSDKQFRRSAHDVMRALRCRMTIVRQYGLAGLMKFQRGVHD